MHSLSLHIIAIIIMTILIIAIIIMNILIIAILLMTIMMILPSRNVPAHSALAHYCRVCNTQLNSCKQVSP